MFADGAAGAGHGAPLKLLSLASQGFSLCHSGGFHHGPVWQLQMVGLARAPLPYVREGLCVSLLGARSCPSNLSFTCSSPELGGRQALQDSGALMPGFIRLPREVPGNRLEQPGVWFCVSPSGPSGSILGLWANAGEICPPLQPSCTGGAPPRLWGSLPSGETEAHQSPGRAGTAAEPESRAVPAWNGTGRAGWGGFAACPRVGAGARV